MSTNFGWDYPAGVTQLPGESAQDAAWESFIDSIPHACPKCKQSTAGDGDHGLADHVTISGDHAPSAMCAFPMSDDDPDDVCEQELADTNCGCQECDPPDHRGLD